MRTRTGVLALTLLAACGEGPAHVTSGPSSPPPASPSASPSASASPTMLSCRGSDRTFPASVLDEPADAENDTGGAADALRAWLRDPDNEMRARPGRWRALVVTDTFAQYGQGDPPGIVVAFERVGKAWRWRGSQGTCPLWVVPPQGLANASWVPDAPVRPGDTTFVAQVSESACASGAPPTGRIEPPAVTYTATTVVVTFFVRPPGGGQTCPGAPPAPYEVTLREPLGDRALLDGNTYPAATPSPPY